MPLDEKPPNAVNATGEVEQVSKQATESAEDAPLTAEMFAAQMQRLAERARAAGLNPIRALGQTYLKRGIALVDGMLSALEDDDSSKKKKA